MARRPEDDAGARDVAVDRGAVRLRTDDVPSPVGPLRIVADDHCVVALEFADDEQRLQHYLRRRYGEFVITRVRDPLGVSAKLRRYLRGDLAALDDIAVDPRGTPFQELVWRELRGIPPGSTRSYGALAARIGNPSASRAVGLANSRNPIAIVVPCHRVIGADGSLTGYAGGIERKRWLLEHEGARDQLPLGL